MAQLLDRLKNNHMLPERIQKLTTQEMEERIWQMKEELGEKLFIPAHHYQKDEVVQFADATGDSLQLAQLCEANKKAEYIVFCGVHFMAETADILTTDEQKVLLPDLRAGCSLADMATISQTEKSWEILQDTFGDTIIPLTYVNSTAAIKAFVGKHQGATVTSSNAKEVITWAGGKKERILFLPDQHLGRNISYELGVPLENMAVWDPIENALQYEGEIQDVEIILWKGHCSVHENFTADNVAAVREQHPDIQVIVHPECPYETVQAADISGSTSAIIQTIEEAPAGSKWAIGTEMNLVQRLMDQQDDKEIISLNPYLCACLTMNRITLPYLLHSLESILSGEYQHEIRVEQAIANDAALALDRMLNILS